MATIADQAPALELGNLRLNEADNPSSGQNLTRLDICSAD